MAVQERLGVKGEIWQVGIEQYRLVARYAPSDVIGLIVEHKRKQVVTSSTCLIATLIDEDAQFRSQMFSLDKKRRGTTPGTWRKRYPRLR